MSESHPLCSGTLGPSVLLTARAAKAELLRRRWRWRCPAAAASDCWRGCSRVGADNWGSGIYEHPLRSRPGSSIIVEQVVMTSTAGVVSLQAIRRRVRFPVDF